MVASVNRADHSPVGPSQQLERARSQALVRQTALPAYNVQTAVDAEHALIVAHAVVLDASDIRCLKLMAEAAKQALEVETFNVVAMPVTQWRSGRLLRSCRHDAGCSHYAYGQQTREMARYSVARTFVMNRRTILTVVQATRGCCANTPIIKTVSITVAGKETDDRFCVIDMHVPPGGGPGPHRHNFEETFVLLEGEMEVTFRRNSSTVRAGDTINVPSNAPHQFHNSSSTPVRLICICSAAGNDRFFSEVGVPVTTRTTPPPKLDEKQMVEFLEKAKAIAPKYHTELLERA